MIDNRTPHLDLPLPDPSNLMQSEDVPRLIQSLQKLDTAVDGKADKAALDQRIGVAEKGAADGVAPLGADRKVPVVYLPNHIDAVVEYPNEAALPAVGQSGVLYFTTDTDPATEWRWSGTAYQKLTKGYGTTDDVVEGAANKYFTAQRVRDVLLAGVDFAVNAVATAADSVGSAIGKLQAQVSANAAAIAANTTAIAGKQNTAAKDASDGYVGLSLFKINFRNAANTVTSFFTNANTAARTYLFPDRDITVAGLDDVTAAGGSMKLLGQYVVGTAVANIDFLNIFSAAYDKYVVELQNILPSVADVLVLRVAIGGAVDTSQSYSNNSITLFGLQSSGTQDASTASNFTVEIRNANGAGRKGLEARGFYKSTSTSVAILNESDFSKTAALSGVRFYWNSGAAFSAGTVRVYGIKNS